jgi:hypothetical protein
MRVQWLHELRDEWQFVRLRRLFERRFYAKWASDERRTDRRAHGDEPG